MDGGRLMGACEGCLRRARLIALLAPRIAGLLAERRHRRPAGLLALPDDELLSAVAGARAGELLERLDGVDGSGWRGLDGARASTDTGPVPVCRHDRGYPPPLLSLPDPPAVLFCVGRPGALERLAAGPAVAIVGSRRASPYGLEMAESLGRGLGAAGVPVISGLALGIDAAAHRGCLAGGGLPVAVLAGGADVPYPRRNRRLYERVRGDGVVISELPPGQRAFRWSFPARNRIMSGLARMTVVVEAAQPSGSLITAGVSEDIGRAVGAVPGRATARQAAGSNALLRDGAAVIRDAEDVLEELFGAGRAPAIPRERPSEPDDATQRRVLAAVEDGLTPAAICERTGLAAADVRVGLARLEAGGWVRPDGRGAYVRLAG